VKIWKEQEVKIRQAIRVGRLVVRNVILGANISSLSMVYKPTDMVYYVSECLYLYKTLNSKRGIQQRQVYEVLPAKNVEKIKLGNFNFGTWFWHSPFAVDIVNLCLICQIIDPKIVFEIGTLTGYTAFHFALNTCDDSKIFTLDLPKGESIASKIDVNVCDQALVRHARDAERYAFENSDAASKVACLFGDSTTFDFSPFHGKVDLFFVDGAHSYKYVRSDTLNALKCCHPGSVIAWHDFGRVGVNDVSRWLLEFANEHVIYCTPGGSLAFMVVK
jgi:hypothetical protein